MPDFCDLCGANLALVGKLHRCVPKAASVANNKSETVANNTGVLTTVSLVLLTRLRAGRLGAHAMPISTGRDNAT